jgi:hypothetical protein
MGGLWEKVSRLDSLQMVAIGPAQLLQITGQGSWITAHIHNLSGPQV